MTGYDIGIVGTIHYLPPEIIYKEKRKWTELYKCDIWSIGIICFVLVSGQLPFYGNNDDKIIKSIYKGKYKWPKKVILTDECKDFIKNLLKYTPKRRTSAKEALNHK